MRRTTRVPLALVAGLLTVALPPLAKAERPGFIPPPLGASDIPGDSQRSDIAGDIDPNKEPAAAPKRARAEGAWVPADGERSIDTLLGRLVGGGALQRLATRLGRAPVIGVVRPTVRTAERVDGAALARRSATLLGRSGQVVVAGPSAGVDALLLGYLGAFSDSAGRVELRSTLVGLSLIDVVTGEKLWVDVHAVRRLLRDRPAGTAQIEPLDHDRAVDLSGRLADHDATATAAWLAEKLGRARWLARSAPARVRLAPLRDRTGEAFPAPFLTLPLERALSAMPRVKLLASAAELAVVRRVPALRRPGVRERRAAELGATHVIRGILSSAVDQVSGQPSLRLRTYDLSFEAVAAARDHAVWAGSHAIKKVIVAGGPARASSVRAW